MLVCSQCKRFVKHSTIYYKINGFDQIMEVKGKCKKCGTVDIDWGCYEEVAGYD